MKISNDTKTMAKTSTAMALVLGVVFVLPAGGPTQAQSPNDEVYFEDIIVTATRTPTMRRKLGSSITVITSEDLEKQQAATVADVLRRVPGVSIQSNGPVGTSSVAKFRGLEEEHTLVLINGVRQNDPGNARNTFNFEHLMATNIERIEIIRGPQATLYGSRANGAVINIITKRGSGSLNGQLRLEGGSFSTRLAEGNVNGGGILDNGMGYDLSFNGAAFTTEGFSAANEGRAPQGRDRPTENDGAQNYNFGLNAGIRPSDNSEVRVSFDHTTLFAEFDRSLSRVAFDADRTKDKEVYSYSLVGRYDAFEGFLENEVTLAGTNNYEIQTYDLDFNNGSRSWTKAADYKGTMFLSDDDTLTFGLGWDQERYARLSGGTTANPAETLDVKKAQTNYFVQTQNGFFDRLFLTAGASYDHFDDLHESALDGELTYRGGLSFDIKETATTLKASYATGFAAPTLFQQNRFTNTATLVPEETELWDAGFEQVLLNDRVRFGATYFRNEVTDQIIFISTTDGYANRDKMKSQGVETTFNAVAYDKDGHRVDLSANHTYTLAVDQDGIEIDRVPRNSLNLAIDYGFLNGKGNVRLDAGWQSTHKDFYNTNGQDGIVRIGDHWRFDIASSYQVRDNLRLHGRLENIFDRDYESAAGFGQTPFAAYAGLTYSFD